MKVGILGTRGIPNNYGGFEQFAEYIAEHLATEGVEVVVYNPDFHPYQEKEYKGVQIIHKYCPENKFGAAAHFIYDFLCLKDAFNRDFDIIFEAGYATVAPSFFLLRKKGKAKIVTNMDGIEWKRSKWSKPVKTLMKIFEKISVKRSDVLVSDNLGIQSYYKERFNVESEFIAYGADLVQNYENERIDKYNVTKDNYLMLVARMEPENNIEMILDGYVESGSDLPFLVIGGVNKFAEYLKEKFKGTGIQFIGGVYDKDDLDALRKNCGIYFHGHSVGGTNPSLLEAMASEANLAVHNNQFNVGVVQENAVYFENSKKVAEIIKERTNFEFNQMIEENKKLIQSVYSWKTITKQYLDLFKSASGEL